VRFATAARVLAQNVSTTMPLASAVPPPATIIAA
jgi:hypothetical protein